jgi:hypothetical protein
MYLTFDKEGNSMYTFDCPEFYDVGLCATVYSNDGKVFVVSEGERCLTKGNEIIRTAREFRDRFPDGVIPSDSLEDDGWSWVNNGWFEIYTEDQMNSGLEGEVTYSLTEAIDIAHDTLYKMESDNDS